MLDGVADLDTPFSLLSLSPAVPSPSPQFGGRNKMEPEQIQIHPYLEGWKGRTAAHAFIYYYYYFFFWAR